MADPICRWRNPYVKTIVELVKILPHKVMPSDEYRTIVENQWPGFLRTAYQLACQVGLYYESDDGIYYPRFDHDIEEVEAYSYMQRWIRKYYVPNPYTKSMKTLQQPQPFLASIIGYICEHPDEKALHSILENVFQEKIGNIDIISNVLNTYTDVMNVDNNGNVELTVKAKDFMKEFIDRNDKKAFFEIFSDENRIGNDVLKDEPLQQIFYGAPGTGKSDEVDDMCSKYIHHRITFHPDTDYSAFVGCYKPKTHKKNLLAGNGINETQLLSSFFDSNSPKYKSKNKARYLYEALIHTKDIRDLGLDAQSVSDKLNKQGFEGCAYTTEATCMYNIYDWLKEDGYIVENKIAYEFIPQCFIKAYVDAWKNQKEGKPVFLVIEEINRGNCAQIFGDLFQLLDRDKNRFSRYEISPDTDLQEYLAEQGLNLSGITDHEGNDISAQIANGELMKLPNNLYIWATMNTSDQSLFPIDSAFKRRWEWKYIKIKKGIDKQTKEPLNWQIKVGEEIYDWWEFLKKINFRIAQMTSSADKQLGYFFCLADNNEISADTFVNKVAFYLWNDVFKDYAEDGSPLLKYKKKEDDKEESDLTFPDFFDEKGKIDANVVKQFIDNVMKEDKTDNKAE